MNLIPILHADDQLIVVDKPANLLSVPGRGPDKQDCLLSRLQRQFADARIVHRLDCATSGVMVLARNADSHRELSRQFHDREVDKTYEAVVSGRLAQDQGEVDLPLRCDWERRPRQIVDPLQGKRALTRWQVAARQVDCTRVRLYPVTGRSHQLRVHMQALGHPILGDDLYAPPQAQAQAPRLLLHACRLSFRHPISREWLTFSARPPF